MIGKASIQPKDEEDNDGNNKDNTLQINQPDDIMSEIDLDEEDLPDATEVEDNDDLGMEECDATINVEVDDSIHSFQGHLGPVYAVACCPTTSTSVATAGEDELVYLWHIGDGEYYDKLQGHTDSVTSLEFNADGRLLASGGLDGVVNVWESSSGDLKCKLEGPSGTVEWLQWHPKGNLVLAGSDDCSSWLWNAERGSCMQVFSGHSGGVTCGSFTPDGKMICTGSEDGSLRVWNPKSGESVHVVKRGHRFHSEVLTCMSVSHDSRIVITGSMDTKACLVNLQSGDPITSLAGHSDSIQCVRLLSELNQSLAITGALDGQLIIWDLQTAVIRNTCEHDDAVLQLLWSPTSQLICSGSSDGKVRIWDPRTGNCEHVFQGHSDQIQSLALSNDGNFILSGSDDHSARVFAMLN